MSLSRRFMLKALLAILPAYYARRVFGQTSGTNGGVPGNVGAANGITFRPIYQIQRYSVYWRVREA
jgi:hypothetical protein